MFSKTFFLSVVKSRDCVVKELKKGQLEVTVHKCWLKVPFLHLATDQYQKYYAKRSDCQVTIIISPRVLIDVIFSLINKEIDDVINIIFLRRTDDSHCDLIHTSFTTVHCFNNGYVGKQPGAWKEYYVE